MADIAKQTVQLVLLMLSGGKRRKPVLTLIAILCG